MALAGSDNGQHGVLHLRRLLRRAQNELEVAVGAHKGARQGALQEAQIFFICVIPHAAAVEAARQGDDGGVQLPLQKDKAGLNKNDHTSLQILLYFSPYTRGGGKFFLPP